MFDKVAVVTGSNKGIGFAIVKGLCQRFKGDVYLTSRDEARGKLAVADLNNLGLSPKYHQLDVTDIKSVKAFRDYIKEKHGGLDILINNAGIATIHCPNIDEENNIINTNFRSILTMQEFIYPLVRKNGRILNISSNCGHLSNIRNKYWIERLSKKDLTLKDINELVDWYLESVKKGTFNKDDIADNGTIAAYRISKVALSAVTILQQKELESRNISVNSMHPGFVSTDMTNNVGYCTSDDAAKTPIYMILDAPQSLKGAYAWYDGNVLDWYDHEADYFFKFALLKNHISITI